MGRRPGSGSCQRLLCSAAHVKKISCLVKWMPAPTTSPGLQATSRRSIGESSAGVGRQAAGRAAAARRALRAAGNGGRRAVPAAPQGAAGAHPPRMPAPRQGPRPGSPKGRPILLSPHGQAAVVLAPGIAPVAVAVGFVPAPTAAGRCRAVTSRVHARRVAQAAVRRRRRAQPPPSAGPKAAPHCLPARRASAARRGAPGVAPLLEGSVRETEGDGAAAGLFDGHLEIVQQAAARHRVVGLQARGGGVPACGRCGWARRQPGSWRGGTRGGGPPEGALGLLPPPAPPAPGWSRHRCRAARGRCTAPSACPCPPAAGRGRRVQRDRRAGARRQRGGGGGGGVAAGWRARSRAPALPPAPATHIQEGQAAAGVELRGQGLLWRTRRGHCGSLRALAIQLSVGRGAGPAASGSDAR